MILSGWKDIADHLRCGVRTAQRWEEGGLPVSRPFPSGRSHVVADSQELDLWLRDGVAWRRGNSNLIARIERCRKLRADVQSARQTLREKVAVLRREVAAHRAAAEQLRRRNDASLKKKSAQAGAA